MESEAQLERPRADKFPDLGERPWLDLPDAEEQIETRLRAGEISEEGAEQCHFWREHGYITLQAIEAETLDQVWNAYERAIQHGAINLSAEPAGPDDPYPGRIADPHLRGVPEICRVMRHPVLMHWANLLFGREAAPFQTITSHKGSQQGVHSDSIHMTTHPLGFLVAAWIAFEDIHPDSGPLVYYPGSHQLPYVLSHNLGIEEDAYKTTGYQSYHDLYEPRIREIIETEKLEPHYFIAKKGEVLFWHANLLHGGSTRRDLSFSRKALVCHYFAEGVICYHDLSASHTRPFSGTCLTERNPAPPPV